MSSQLRGQAAKDEMYNAITELVQSISKLVKALVKKVEENR